MVSEVFLHGQLAPLLSGLWQGRNIMVESSSLNGIQKGEKTGRGQGQDVPFKTTPLVTYIL
jgi:hypothetical protein